MKSMNYLRIILATLVLACSVPAVRPVFAQEPAPHVQSTPGETAHDAEQGEGAAGGGWLPVIAKAFNFAILAGVLVYFLKTPLLAYMDGRIKKVREDLVTAAETRETASRQLAEIDAKLKQLPAEIEQLKARGAEDLAAERARIEAAAETERQRLLAHTRREIDMRVQVARRQLIEHAATLAVQVASSRIQQTMTPDDQARLVDRYSAQLSGETR
jgi:F-type H+-transporting ATPase subunit b